MLMSMPHTGKYSTNVIIIMLKISCFCCSEEGGQKSGMLSLHFMLFLVEPLSPSYLLPSPN